MAPLLSASASQINVFNDCSQHWYNAHILKIEVPQSDKAFAGEVLHKQAEDYTTKGIMPEHPSVLKALEYIAPPMTPNVFAEFWLDSPKLYIAGLKINGKVDYRDERDPTHPRIYDYKTKEKLDKYLKTKRTLLKDVQVNVYGAWALAKYKQAEAVTFAHIYLLREGDKAPVPFVPDAKFVPTDPVPRETILENVKEFIEPALAKMKEIADGKVQPEKNHSKCEYWFGKRCPFYDRCFGTTESFKNLFTDFTPPPATESEETMTLLSKLTATKDETPSIPLPETFIGTVSKTEAPAPGPSTATAAGLTLYVDCLPEKFGGTYLILADEIARRSEIIMREAGVKTLHEKPLDFGKGKAKLEDSFRLAPLTGTVFATSGGMSTGVIEVLVPLASTVVRGVR